MDATQSELMKMISQIYRRTQMYLNEQVKEIGLSSALTPFLLLTCENGIMTQTKFCERLDMSKGAVAKALAKLEQLGYVVRQNNQEDGRSIDVYPTEQAMEIYPYLVERGKLWAQKMTAGMTEMERSIFFQMLKKISDNIDGEFDRK